MRDRDDDVHDTDRRQADDGTIVGQLYALAATFLHRPVTTAEKSRLKTLFRGGPFRRQAKASAITLELLAWKAGGGERDVTTYKKALRAGRRPAVEFLRYR